MTTKWKGAHGLTRRVRWPALLVALALAGCASAGAHSGASADRRDPNVITQSELAGENATNVYEAILHLRPEMLRPHPSSQSSSIQGTRTGSPDYSVHVYIDNNLLGGISELRTIPVGTVREIRYLNPSQATQQFGTGNPGGVIALVSR